MKLKSYAIAAAACLSALAMTSCGTMGSGALAGGTAQAPAAGQGGMGSTATDILGNLLGGLIGNAIPVNENNIVGTWVYSSPEVRFESEDFLSQAGGQAAAVSIEKKLAEIYASIGITPGSGSFTFNSDKTCKVALGATSFNGTYTIDPKNNAISITSSTGLIKLNGKVYFGLNSLVILFDSNKILSIAQTLATFTGKGGGTLGTLASALGNYKGLMLGMNLKK